MTTLLDEVTAILGRGSIACAAAEGVFAPREKTERVPLDVPSALAAGACQSSRMKTYYNRNIFQKKKRFFYEYHRCY